MAGFGIRYTFDSRRVDLGAFIDRIMKFCTNLQRKLDLQQV